MSPEFIPGIFSNIWSIALVILFFGGSIFVHELGHFLAARRRGLHVERFSIGFGPRLFTWKRNGVEYCLSLLPLGGYVALPQLADMRGVEGEAAEEIRRLPPIGYADKMIVSVMGAVFNVLFAFLLASVLWFVGQPSSAEQQTTTVGGVMEELVLPDGSRVPGPAWEAGIRPGDTILAIDGKVVSSWMEMQQTLFAGSGRTGDGEPRAVLTIRRDGEIQNLTVLPRLAGDERFRMVGIEPAEDLTVHQVMPDSPAESGGLRAGDVIVLVDGKPIYQIDAFRRHLMAHHERPIAVTVLRKDQPFDLRIQPRLETIPESGESVARAGFSFSLGYRLIHTNPVKQITNNVVVTWRVLSGLVSPKSDINLSHMSGPPGIARALYVTSQIDIRLLLWFTILINVNLAIFNLLPIPVLDGGHMAFATIAKLRGKALPPNLINATQSVFILLLLTLMIYVSFSDIRRWVRDARGEARMDVPAEAQTDRSEEDR